METHFEALESSGPAGFVHTQANGVPDRSCGEPRNGDHLSNVTGPVGALGCLSVLGQHGATCATEIRRHGMVPASGWTRRQGIVIQNAVLCPDSSVPIGSAKNPWTTWHLSSHRDSFSEQFQVSYHVEFYLRRQISKLSPLLSIFVSPNGGKFKEAGPLNCTHQIS